MVRRKIVRGRGLLRERRVARAAWLCGLLALAVAVHESRAEPPAGNAPRPPGRLVDVGGHRMHLYCTGSGAPTVVLETGLGGMSAAWGWIQPALARETRVCSYDRSGLGWSEMGDEPHDAAHVAGQLHRLLAAAGERGPYLLVGHSLGGMFVREFARRWPGETAGLVLLDPAHPDQRSFFPARIRREQALLFALARLAPAVAGMVRPGEILSPLVSGLPAPDAGALRWFLSFPRHLQATRAEVDAWDETCAEVRGAGSLGSRPLLVLTAGDTPEEWMPAWRAMHLDLAGLSRRGLHLEVAGAGHATLVLDRGPAERVARIIGYALLQAREGGAR